MDEERLLSVDEFIGGNGEDFFITDAEDLTTPAYLEAFSIVETEY